MKHQRSAPVIITAGPAYEPIDKVRRLTNFSTGTLGCTLAGLLTRRGYDVTLLLSDASSYRGEIAAGRILNFSTNDSLAKLLQELGSAHAWHGVLHAAALADFKVDEVLDDHNQPFADFKISSSASEIRIVCKPAPKVIRQLRTFFPAARIAGWKYEMDGSRQNALLRGWSQIEDCKTDACIVNGAAYGDGYAFCPGRDQSIHLETVAALAEHLAHWLEK